MLKGIAASSGIAIGRAYKLQQPTIVLREDKGDTQEELALFERAITKTISDIEKVKARVAVSLSEDELAIFRRRKIGLIYQFYNLVPILNVVENITLPILLDNNQVDKDYLDELLGVLSLKNRLNHLPNQLSGGEQQRVSIARALITRPNIILADEPTGNLDSKNSLEIIKLLKLCNKKYNQTILMITHDDNLAKLADRIITIVDGKIVSDVINSENIK